MVNGQYNNYDFIALTMMKFKQLVGQIWSSEGIQQMYTIQTYVFLTTQCVIFLQKDTERNLHTDLLIH